MNQVHPRDRRTRMAASLQAVQRPLSGRERRGLRSLDKGHDPLAALERLLSQGDERAEAMAYALVYRTMMERMFDRRRGAVPRFVGRLRKVVDSLEASIR